MANDKHPTPDDRPVVVLEHSQVFDTKTFQVTRAELQYRQSDGTLSEPLTRFAVVPGDAVGVLAYDPRAEVMFFVRQFRYPVFERLPGDAPSDTVRQAAWLLEIVAGKIDDGESAEQAVRRELREETGFEVAAPPKQIGIMYPSPGNWSEQITIFLAEVDTAGARGQGGGTDKGEDTEIVTMPIDEVLRMLERGEFHDGKTLIALQHFALRRQAAPAG